MEAHTARWHSAANFVQGQVRPCRRGCWRWAAMWLSPLFLAPVSAYHQDIPTSAAWW